MAKTRERYEQQVGQDTGETRAEKDVMEPKQRSLTNQELTGLKEQRNRQLDELEEVAVREGSEYELALQEKPFDVSMSVLPSPQGST